MPRFDMTQIEEAKTFFYHSCIHDAKLVTFQHDRKKKSLTLTVWNPIWNIGYRMNFSNMKFARFIGGIEQGDADVILSATIDHVRAQSERWKNTGDALCLDMGFFSGDEIELVFDVLQIETMDTVD